MTRNVSAAPARPAGADQKKGPPPGREPITNTPKRP